MSQNIDPQDLFQKAEKKFKMTNLVKRNKKYEDVSLMYFKAANLFKMSKKWEEAATSFIRAHECELILECRYQASTYLIKAAECYRKVSSDKVATTLTMAIDILIECGHFSIAAKCFKDIAEIYEKDDILEKAILYYEKASDLFQSENENSQANQCKLKIALYSAELGKYDKAILIYESIATESLGNNLSKWSAKEYFLKAGILHLCAGDVVSARKGYERYQELDLTFKSQTESIFLNNLISCYEVCDVMKFTKIVCNYDRSSKLDSWEVSMLLKIKKQLKENEESIMI
ncbi:alpha-soluble nsf attachment protein [Anaeramoeba flamelloides]|uniref:Alpha-soluble nsf attachment protein n=1 Tax=Anaeramoeba flamelloides TaxID=1746091 RepID=A0ABQ8Z1C1_9EUKA|nr:alpha-soluble nsf attachment protein [Anaeramoeba flamelloides]